jgi:hypothetical protein
MLSGSYGFLTDRRGEMKVTVIYLGQIEMECNAPDQTTAEEVVLDEIDTWSEALFLERLELTIEEIKFD